MIQEITEYSLPHDPKTILLRSLPEATPKPAKKNDIPYTEHSLHPHSQKLEDLKPPLNPGNHRLDVNNSGLRTPNVAPIENRKVESIHRRDVANLPFDKDPTNTTPLA
ncbi:Hypothetical predicted protein [Pelobates cultripes]|uniref:Uncharacterized protein n=1 Tax=Pelobates cultripes TaxID=61616 RepID=A0AAD1VMC2_PELCU|nr:Hypothetical predicted protein [Pelobates cultripes]